MIIVHGQDEECTLGPDDVCTGCGALHGEPCAWCGGRAYHRPRCAHWLTQRWLDGNPIDPALLRDPLFCVGAARALSDLGEERAVKKLEAEIRAGRWGFYFFCLEIGSRNPRDPVGVWLKRRGLWPW